MNVRKYTSGLAASALLASGLALAATSPASADPTFTPDATSIVGVGSDTIEFVVGDLAAGKDINGVHVDGWNAAHPTQRIASYNATGPSPVSFRSTSAGAVLRPNGSGAGKATLFAGGNNTDVNFARSSSSLSATEAAALTQYPFAVDGLRMAVSGSVASHAPASLTAAQIVDIYKGTYKKWSDINPGFSTAFIHPLIPQAGSGTRSFFVAELKAANGNADVVLAAGDGNVGGYPGVKETQEHSPTDIQNDPDAVGPFSTARQQTLLNPAVVKLEGGYAAQRAVYNVVRNGDTGTTWATGIFGSAGFFCSAAAKPIIEANGFAQLASVGNGGVCGQALTAPPANLNTNTVPTTTTLVAATTATAQQVKLTATVAAGGQSADGTVKFFEGATQVGTALPSGGQAVLTLSNVASGTHTYTAQFASANPVSFTNSESVGSVVVVKEGSTTSATVVASSWGHKGSATVTVTSTGSTAGDVTVKVGTTVVGTKATTLGKATFELPASLTAGAQTLTATFAPTSDLVAPSTGTKAFTRARSAVVLTEGFAASFASGAFGKGTVKVALSPTSGLKPAGTIIIKKGATAIGKGTLSATGVATITLNKKLAKGTYTLVASYGGSSNTLAKTLSFKVTQK